MWRYIKSRLQNLLDLAVIRQRYGEIIASLMAPDDELLGRIGKWFNLSRKYIEYYARGGIDFLREASMRALDLQAVGQAPHSRLIGSVASESTQAHELNWLLLQGKKRPEEPRPW